MCVVHTFPPPHSSPLSHLWQHLPGTSASAQWSRIPGSDLGKRQGKGPAHDDDANVVLFGEEDQDPSPSKQQRIEFDDDDDVQAPEPTTSTPAPRPRATKVYQTGVNHKDADLLVVHPKAMRLLAKDGVVQINP